MASMSKVGTHKTRTYRPNDDKFWVKYHNTMVIRIDKAARTIKLDSGGWRSATTKTRMNQAINQELGWGAGVSVYQKNHEWFVATPESTLEFTDGMEVTF